MKIDKKVLLGILICTIGTATTTDAIFGKIKKGFEEKIIKPTEKKVIKPAGREIKKVAQDVQKTLDPNKQIEAALNNLKKIEKIDIKAVERNVDQIKANVMTIQAQARALQQNVSASKGPATKGALIANQLKKLQASVKVLQKGIDLSVIKRALFDPSVTLPAAVDQEFAKALKLFDEVLANTFSIELNPVLDNLIVITQNAQRIMILAMDSHQKSGTAAELVLNKKVFSSLKPLARDLSNIATDLQQIKQHSITDPEEIQNKLADAILFKTSQLTKTIQSVDKTVATIKRQSNALVGESRNIVRSAQQLLAQANRLRVLPKTVERAIKQDPGQVVFAPKIARDELNRILHALSKHLSATLLATSKSFLIIANVVQTVEGLIEQVKKELEIVILTPQAEQAVGKLIKDLRALSGSINTTRRAIGIIKV